MEEASIAVPHPVLAQFLISVAKDFPHNQGLRQVLIGVWPPTLAWEVKFQLDTINFNLKIFFCAERC